METALYLSDCVNEVLQRGETKFNADNVDYLIRAVNALIWNDPGKSPPEVLPHYHGRKVIPCLVMVAPPKSCPGRRPRVTVAQRQLVGLHAQRWEWSRGLDVMLWRELPDV